MKIPAKIKYIFFPLALLLHVVLIYARGYFLSGEFTLYPYLVSRGFLPYMNIIDQHFPTLLFGPFSLPAFLTVNPWPLMGVFLVTLCLTDIFFYFSLTRYKINRPAVWLVLYIVSSVYFSGNILWMETFVNLLISIWLFLSFSKNFLRRFASGFILSQILLLRPTIAPALLILLISLSGFSWSLVLGGLIGLAIPALFLIRFGLISDFYNLAIRFNQTVYPKAASLFPAKRQILAILVWLTPVIYSVLKNKKIKFLFILLFLLVLVIPRFGYEHLQPLFLLGVLFWALTVQKPQIPVYLFIFFLFVLNIVSAIRHPYGNFYLTPEVQKAAVEIKHIPGGEIYLLGVPDILYQMTGKIPPGYTYVPSLPWYLHEADLQNRIIRSLGSGKPPVLVNDTAEVDGKNIVSESGEIFKYIKMNYTEVEKLGNFRLFLPKL